MERDILKKKMDDLAKSVYHITSSFPKEEIYGITSQLRRAALSVILNYIEGFARRGDKEYRNFLQIAYGSLKEAQYLLFFSFRENYFTQDEYNRLIKLSDEIGAMLWNRIGTVKKKIQKSS